MVAKQTKQPGRVMFAYTDRPRLPLSERIVAASAHLAILLSVPGLVYAAILWLMLRRRAPFISAHALQGLLWQILTNISLLVALVVLFVVALTSFGGTIDATTNPGKDIALLFGSLLGLFVALIAGMTISIGAALIGAVAALVGRTFRYPFVNRRRG